jgi:hypothetical protein
MNIILNIQPDIVIYLIVVAGGLGLILFIDKIISRMEK